MQLRGTISVTTLATLCAGLACVPNLALASITVNAVALTGTSGPLGPGMGAGVTFAGIGQHQPSINDLGQVAFRAVPSNNSGNQGMWIRTGGANNNVMIGGGAMPGGGTYPTGTATVNSPQVNNNGEWAFRLGGTTGLFGTSSGSPQRVVLAADTAPGASGATYASAAAGMPLFNNAGQIGYIATLTTNTGSPPVTVTAPNANATGIWTGTPGATSIALRQNDPVTSIDAGGTVRVGAFQSATLAMNGAGRFVVSSALQGTVTAGTGVGSNATMVASNRSGSLEVVARAGAVAPNASGGPSTDLYRSFNPGSIGFNEMGSIAFNSSLRDAAGVQTATAAVFTDAGPGSMRLVARSGGAVPVMAGSSAGEFAGATWSGLGNPLLNATDTMLLTGAVAGVASGTTNLLMTVDQNGAFTKVARSSNSTNPGQIAIVGGAPLGGDAYFTSFSSTTMNSLGQIAFQALLNGNGIAGGPGGNNSGIFAYTPAGGICLVARTADLFEVAPGDFRQIAALGGIVTSGGADGRVRSLNDNGLLVFQLDFTDGTSGVFTASIPSPSAAALLGLGFLAASRRRRA